MQVPHFGFLSDTQLVSGVPVQRADSYSAVQILEFEGPAVTRYNPDHIVSGAFFLSFLP